MNRNPSAAAEGGEGVTRRDIPTERKIEREGERN